MIQSDQVEEVVVTYADRLSRYGLEYLTMLFEGFKVRFTVLQKTSQKALGLETRDEWPFLVYGWGDWMGRRVC